MFFHDKKRFQRNFIARQCGWLIVCLGVVTGLASDALATGCHLNDSAAFQSIDGSDSKRAQGDPLYRGPARVLYTGGKLLYFAVYGNSAPCDGPGCKGSAPQQSVRTVAIASIDPTPELASFGFPAGFQPESGNRFLTSGTGTYLQPEQSGLLRPPCA